MEVITGRAAFRAACDGARDGGTDVGLVSTMGALHDGHLSLLAAARDQCGFVAMTLFVNPMQFGPGEDLQAYPRTPQADIEAAERAGCDVVFQPVASEMYPRGEPEVTIDPGPLGHVLEGAERPGHFRGVLTVLAKLFALAGPCRAYFGEKDAQQLALIRRMVGDLDTPVEIVSCATVREADGLAISSRNARLSPKERSAAPVMWQALSEGRGLVERGVHTARWVREQMADVVASQPLVRLDYAAVVDFDTWEDVERIRRPVRLLMSARLGRARLIDNTIASPPAFTGQAASPARPVGVENRLVLLAVDAGNTETVVGVFRGNELSPHWRSSTREDRTADELTSLIGGFLERAGLSLRSDVTGMVVASVVPAQTQALREMSRNEFDFAPVVVEPGTRTGISILYDNPKDVGADRIANAAAAHERFGGPTVVVDFGTATTFDVVSANAEYLGGVIVPGLKVSAGALFNATARLPRVEIVPPRSIIARTTVESVQAGLVYGTAAMVDGVVERIAKEVGAPTVVATGGLAPLVVDQCASVQHHEPWLTLEGLRLIYERNASRDE